MSANPWVRPYVLTRGRTRTRHRLYVHTLVSVDRYERAAAGRLAPEARRLDVSFPAVNYFEHDSSVPFIVAVNLFDGLQTHPLEQVRKALGLSESVPLVTVDARSRRSAAQVLMASLANTLEKTSPLLAR